MKESRASSGKARQTAREAASKEYLSRFEVQFVGGEERALRVLRAGNPNRELADVVRATGALPGARISVTPNVMTGEIDVQVSGRGYQMARTIRGESIRNDWITTAATGRGLGARLFARQVTAASRLGFRRITATAAGGPGQSKSGYYAWARLGYQGRISEAVQARMPASLRSGTTQELMAKPGGAAWWKASGESFEGTFSLERGSTSRRVLSGYLREKRVK